MGAVKYIVKQSSFDGIYHNPYLKGGRGMRWKSWKTVSKHDTVTEALAAAVVRVGLARRAVFYRGVRISDGDRLLDSAASASN
jgi:hypothetical protein